MSREQVELTDTQVMQAKQDFYQGCLEKTELRLTKTATGLVELQASASSVYEILRAKAIIMGLGIARGFLTPRIRVLEDGITASRRMLWATRLHEGGVASDAEYSIVQTDLKRAQVLIAPPTITARVVRPESAKLPAAPVPQLSFVVSTDLRGANINGKWVDGNFGICFAAGIAQAFKDGQTELPRKQLQQLLPPAGDKSSGTLSTYLSRARKIFTELGFKVTLRRTGNTIEAMILEGTLSQPVSDSINNLPVTRLGNLLYVNGILFNDLDAKVLQALAPTYLTKPPQYVPRADIQGILEQVRGAQIPEESLRAITSKFLSGRFEPRLQQASLALYGIRSGRSLLYRLIDQQTVTPAESASEGVQPEPADDVKKKPSAPLKQEA